MLTSAKTILTQAKKEKKAVGAFNVSSVEVLHAIFSAAAEKKSQILIETSRGESEHLSPELLATMCEKLGEIYGVEYALHLDRAQQYDWIKRCLDAGYNSVTAESLNPGEKMSIEETIRIRELADKYDAQLEGSIEVVPIRYYKDKQQKHLDYTDPEEAKEFVEATRVDSIVISIGTQSGSFKSIDNIRFEILEEVNKLMPEVPFVLHGGSFLDPQIVTRAIDNGISKINVNAELREAYTKTLKANIEAKPEEYAPYRLLKGAVENMREVVENKITLFNNSK